MAIIMGLETKFNEVPYEYDKWRPTYVPELYTDIFNYKEINQLSKVLEIGIGTGQATLPILNTNCHLTAIELGNNLAEFSKQKFIDYEKFEVKNMSFQDFDCPDNTYDMIYSASAFHWIPEEIGYSKVYKLLKSGGIFARFANHPYKDKGKEEIHAAMQKVYAKYMPNSLESLEYSVEQCRERANISSRYGFIDICYKMYQRTRTFNADEYVSLLNTYSDHRAIDDEKRVKFFNEIKDAINNLGGKITIYDTIDLQLARKP
ncbi:MAG: dimethyladenosine transferase [Anaerocolumna sp.]|jgi:ubiquinone/menaquinone biosynthesis C-methylase UbiE|nr:dimethyladenosine transferase [Anaerocolumna sp.]